MKLLPVSYLTKKNLELSMKAVPFVIVVELFITSGTNSSQTQVARLNLIFSKGKL